MSDKKLRVLLGFRDNISSGLKNVSQNTEQLTNRFGSLKNVAMGALGSIASGIAGDKLIAGFKATSNSAIQMESAMADVKKVSEGTSEQFKLLENDLLSLSKQIPTLPNKLTQIAAAGGQLGIPREQLKKFTKEVAIAAVAFDLTEEAAGEAFAGISNNLNLPITKLKDVSDTINHLSNNTAASAPKIIEVMNRVSGAFSGIKIAPDQIAGLSALAVQLNLKQPELAASNLMRMVGRLTNKDLQKKLNSLVPDFSNLLTNKPQQALEQLLKKIGEFDGLERSNLITQLFGNEVGIKSFVGKLADDMTKFKSTMGLATDEIARANSAQQEFEARIGITEGKIQLLNNSFFRFKKSIGDTTLGIVAEASSGLVGMLDGLTDFMNNSSLGKGVAGAISGGMAVLGGLGYIFEPVMGLLALKSLFKGGSLFGGGGTGGMSGYSFSKPLPVIVVNSMSKGINPTLSGTSKSKAIVPVSSNSVKLSRLSRMNGAMKGIGAGAVGLSALSFGSTLISDDSWGDKIQDSFSVAGGLAGSLAGAKFGAMAGMIGGPVGVAIGTVAGGVIGGIGGTTIMDKLGNWFRGKKSLTTEQQSEKNRFESKNQKIQEALKKEQDWAVKTIREMGGFEAFNKKYGEQHRAKLIQLRDAGDNQVKTLAEREKKKRTANNMSDEQFSKEKNLYNQAYKTELDAITTNNSQMVEILKDIYEVLGEQKEAREQKEATTVTYYAMGSARGRALASANGYPYGGLNE